MKIRPAAIAALAAVMTVTGCNSLRTPKPAAAVDPNVYPANYRIQIAQFLRQSLTDRADFRGASISQPALKPIQQSQRYVVCVQLNGHNQHDIKVAIYFAGAITQFVNPTPEQCGGAVYQPFTELAQMVPSQ